MTTFLTLTQALQRKGELPGDARALENKLATLTASDVTKMFESALPALNIDETTPKGRRRRVSQMSWMTIATQKRQVNQDEREQDAVNQLLSM